MGGEYKDGPVDLNQQIFFIGYRVYTSFFCDNIDIVASYSFLWYFYKIGYIQQQ